MAQFGLSEGAGATPGGANSNHSSSGMLDNSFKGGGSNGSVSGNNSDSNNGTGAGGASAQAGGGMIKSNSTNLSHSSSNLSGGSNNSNSGNPTQQSHHQSRGECKDIGFSSVVLLINLLSNFQFEMWALGRCEDRNERSIHHRTEIILRI